MGAVRVLVLAMGGTISMDQGSEGAAPRFGGEELLASLPGLPPSADVHVETMGRASSENLDVGAMLGVAERIRRARDSYGGVVVTIGTDALEELAFALDVVLDVELPVVLTGALRNSSVPSADGPANVLDAICVAASPAARGLGVLVVFNQEIHAARFVQKAHTFALDAFRSDPCGPLGWIVEERPRIAHRAAAPPIRVALDAGASVPYVALATTFGGDDGRTLGGFEREDVAGLVIQTLGSGHVSRALVEPLTRLAQRIPVVYASRIPFGDLFTDTYAYPGAEIDLLSRGLICSGALGGPKARALLALLLASGATREQIARVFADSRGG